MPDQLPDHARRRRDQPDAALAGAGRRSVQLTDVQARAADDGGALTFEGHAAVFDETSERLYDSWGYPFREIIRPGAFDDAIAANAAGEEDTKFLGLNHDRNLPLARCGNNTLTLEDDGEGLMCRATLAQTQAARDLAALLDRGDVHQMSFTFTVNADGARWTWDYDTGEDLREVTGVARLYDVSPVVYPAYAGTDAALRGLAELRSLTERDAGDLEPHRLATIGQMLDLADRVHPDVRAAARARQAPAGPPPTSARPATSRTERDKTAASKRRDRVGKLDPAQFPSRIA